MNSEFQLLNCNDSTFHSKNSHTTDHPKMHKIPINQSRPLHFTATSKQHSNYKNTNLTIFKHILHDSFFKYSSSTSTTTPKRESKVLLISSNFKMTIHQTLTNICKSLESEHILKAQSKLQKLVSADIFPQAYLSSTCGHTF